MDLNLNIFDQYIQMRESNSSRELADMSMIKALYAKLNEALAENKQLRSENKTLKDTIALMQAVQPISNTYNIERDYVALQNVNK